MTKHIPARSLLALGLGALLSLGAYADLPQVQRSGNIEYLSGGIGSDESAAFKTASASWPLTLEFGVDAKPRADYAADVKVTIRQGGKPALLETVTTGPYLLVKLPPGQYTVDAVFAGRAMTKPVSVASGRPAHASFIWPAAGQ